ncbi:ABC transporter ATP-binding protein [Amaricoccus tamworthensis]|uniref:ABC transporter ATP-binding protein n=1 Tax=Amaricoccus tamworthensis TaxID=57002 RepID=UPI003C7BC585
MDDPVLELHNLSKSFGALRVTNDVCLKVERKTIHALIGPNGAGKSTLIGQIAGSILPDSGQVILDGEDISNVSVAGRTRRGLARSFQVSAVIPDFTVLQNGVLAVQGSRGIVYRFFRPALGEGAVVDQARTRIEAVGLADREHVPAAALSHGERRRLELAMATALDPKIFLLDEPMAGIGTDGSEEITTILDGLRHTAPVLLVEHDMDVVFRLADMVSVLVDGKILATGKPAEIQENPDVRRVYLGEDFEF